MDNIQRQAHRLYLLSELVTRSVVKMPSMSPDDLLAERAMLGELKITLADAVRHLDLGSDLHDSYHAMIGRIDEALAQV